MNKKNFEKLIITRNSKNGITLIALVITIVILVIISGVVINATLGDNGLLAKVQEARDLYLNAQLDEELKLNELEFEVAQQNLPKNTSETEAGTIVKLPSEWGKKAVKYISTDTGNEIVSVTKVASVYAVAVGGGKSVPVPYKFYYVGGTLDSGVVISDNEADKNKYADDEDGDIPKDLAGNQFVWIPCDAEDYKKVVWKNSSNAEFFNAKHYDITTNGDELAYVEKYGGFYVGRYEAGKGSTTTSGSVQIGANLENTGWHYADWSVKNKTISGNVASKADETPYYHADYYTSLELANRMYKTDYVRSGLLTGTMWDAMLNFIRTDNTKDVTNSDWGNYYNKAITMDSGKYRIINSDGSETSTNVWTNGVNGSTKFVTTTDTRYLLTTGASEQVKAKNLYDVAGNLWEWTAEMSNNADNYYRMMLRGGSFNDYYGVFPACYRLTCTATSTDTNFGFRVALFLK